MSHVKGFKKKKQKLGCLEGEIGGGKAASRRGERNWENTEVDRVKRCCKEKRGETEIEEVVGCARRGEVGKLNNRIGVKHETWNLKSRDFGRKWSSELTLTKVGGGGWSYKMSVRCIYSKKMKHLKSTDIHKGDIKVPKNIGNKQKLKEGTVR